MIVPFSVPRASPLATNAKAAWVAAVGYVAIVGWQIGQAPPDSALLVSMLAALGLLGLYFAYVVGRSGVYASERSVIVVNLLRSHEIAGKDLMAVSPATPTVPGPMVLESRDGRRIKVMFIPSVRSPARQRAYEFIESIRQDTR